MKTMKIIVLTAAIMVCGACIAASASGPSKCDTTKCQIRSCHVGGEQACAGHKGMKCEKAGTAECKDMHAKGTCKGHTPDKCAH
jgi:hypothetical protein